MVRLMKKFLKRLSVISALTLTLILSAVPASAEAPTENGSPAKAAVMEQTEAIVTSESTALPNWLMFSGIGAVVVIGFIAGAVVLGNRAEDDTASETEE